MRALIVEDGYQRGALAACRALGTVGWAVGIGSPSPGGFAASSRWARRWHRVPSPDAGRAGFLESTRAAIADGSYDVVFPSGDAETLALSAGRDRLGARFPYGAHEDVVRALDKLHLAEAARRAGIAVPETGDGLRHRVVVKPRLTTVAGPAGATIRLRAALAEDLAAAQKHVSYLRSLGAEPIVQRYVPGPLNAFIAVADRNQRIVAAVQQRADEIWPSGVGGSVRAATVPVDESLAAKVHALLVDLGWFGLAQVQFQAAPDGEPVLIDLNGRFYGSMALATAAGPNLPAIWASLATDRPLPPIPEPRSGVCYHWLEADLRRARHERRGGLGRDVLDCFRYAGRARHGLWDASDPGPALRHSGTLAVRGLRRLR